MGATQLAAKMTPMTGDPAQQRMMMIMPLMFMVFFLWAPSGLVHRPAGQQLVGRSVSRSLTNR